MTDNKNQGVEKKGLNETPKKRSFFGGEINKKTKDLLDFRYNTQEEIDKLNDEMTTTDDLDEIIEQTNNQENNKDEAYLKEKDEKEAESHLEKDLQSINESLDNDTDNDNYDEIYKKEEPIEGEIVENPNETISDNPNNQYGEETENKENEIEESKFEENDNIEEGKNEIEEDFNLEENETNEENSNKFEEDDEDNKESELGDSVKFFDPFELDLDENNEEEKELNNEIFDPFGLNEEENNNETKENKTNDEKDEINFDDKEDKKVEDNEEVENDEEVEDNEEIEDDEEVENDEKVKDHEDVENDEEIEDDEDVEDNKKVKDNEDVENDEEIEDDEDIEDHEEVENNDEVENDDEVEDEIDEDDIVIDTPISVNPNQKEEKKEMAKERKIKKNSATGETITDEEIKLEQGQDMPNTEDDEEYNPSDEEIFEQEPEFFANDELSQQFLKLVQNVRGIFKLERKDGEQNPYFKILGGKTESSMLEYLFYLIEEEDEPVDLYIKKVEIDQESEEENEHLVQFSYNENKELNIFVDEIILYEGINKSNPDNIEYNDTKAILEKFIFLTQNYYDELQSKLEEKRKERQKKRQLQQIFKGF